MSNRDRIPAVQVGSGDKFVNDRGITAIKDGIKSAATTGERLRKPDWLRVRVRGGATFEARADQFWESVTGRKVPGTFS